MWKSRKVKSVAEYAVRKWLMDQNFVYGCFDLKMDGPLATITDRYGATLKLRYFPQTKTVAEVADDD